MTRLPVVLADAELVAEVAAARLVGVLIEVQATGRVPVVALTGGGTGIAVLTAVDRLPATKAVDWSQVEILWGDERFVAVDDPERNELQARQALLDDLGLDPARVHAMAADGGEFGSDVDAAAAAYAQIVDGLERIDLVMLGMGGEGHVASVFPDSPALSATASVVAVRDCPKPPPTRISLTLPTIRRADRVWILTTGAAKAEAVHAALHDPAAVESDWPVVGAVGTAETIFFVDTAAATAS